MKKGLCAILAASMLICLCGCGDSGNSSSTEDLKKPQSVSSQPEKPKEEPSAKITIEEKVLVDDKGVKITAKELEQDGTFGTGVKLLIENNSDTNLTVQTRNTSINGYMVDAIMSSDVAAGKKANDTLTFTNSALEACGIKSIADLEISFHIFASDGWDSYLDTDPVQIKTSIADTYTYTYDDSGDVAYEGNGVKIVAKGISDKESIFGPGLILYIENTSGKAVTVQARDVSVNGFMLDPIFSEDVVAGKRSVSTMTFMDKDLKQNEISEIKDIELSFHLFDTTSMDTIVDTEKIKLSF